MKKNCLNILGLFLLMFSAFTVVAIDVDDVPIARKLDQTAVREDRLTDVQRKYLENNDDAALRNHFIEQNAAGNKIQIHTNDDGSQHWLTEDDARGLKMQGHFNESKVTVRESKRGNRIVQVGGEDHSTDVGVNSEFQKKVREDGLTDAQRQYLKYLDKRGMTDEGVEWEKRFKEQNTKKPPNVIKINHDPRGYQVAVNSDVAADMANKGYFSSKDHHLEFTSGTASFFIRKSGGLSQVGYEGRAAAHPQYADGDEKSESIETDEKKKQIDSNYQTKVRKNGLTDAQNAYANEAKTPEEARELRDHFRKQNKAGNVIKIHTNISGGYEGKFAGEKVPVDKTVADDLSQKDLFNKMNLDDASGQLKVSSNQKDVSRDLKKQEEKGKKGISKIDKLSESLKVEPVKTVHQNIKEEKELTTLRQEKYQEIFDAVKEKLGYGQGEAVSKILKIMDKASLFTDGKSRQELNDINVESVAGEIVKKLRDDQDLKGKLPDDTSVAEEQKGDETDIEGGQGDEKEDGDDEGDEAPEKEFDKSPPKEKPTVKEQLLKEEGRGTSFKQRFNKLKNELQEKEPGNEQALQELEEVYNKERSHWQAFKDYLEKDHPNVFAKLAEWLPGWFPRFTAGAPVAGGSEQQQQKEQAVTS